MTWLGRVTTAVRLLRGERELVREALVDTGSQTLGLPQDVADALGVLPDAYRPVTSALGPAQAGWVRQLDIEVLGRRMTTDAVITPAGSPVLLGCKQLETMNLNVYPREHAVR